MFNKKIKVEYQAEPSDCGLACAAMVLSHWGYKTNSYEMRREYGASSKGLRIQSLKQILDDKGLESSYVCFDLSRPEVLSLPCILHWNGNHFVILEKVEKDFVYIVDPARGRKRLPKINIVNKATDIALEIVGTKDSFVEKKHYLGFSISKLFNKSVYRGMVSKMIFMILLVQLSMLAIPMVSQNILDNVLATKDLSLLAVMAGGYLAINVFTLVIGILSSLSEMYLSKEILLDAKVRFVKRLLGMPLPFFERTGVTTAPVKIAAVEKVVTFITSSLTKLVSDSLFILAAIAVMIYYSPALSLLVLLSTGLTYLVKIIFMRFILIKTESLLNASSSSMSWVMDALQGVHILKVNARTEEALAKYHAVQKEYTENELGISGLKSVQSVFVQLIGHIENIAFLVGASIFMVNSDFSVGMFYAFLMYKSQFSSRVNSLVDVVIEYKCLAPHKNRIIDVMLEEREPEVKRPSGATVEGHISVTSLSYRYSRFEPYVFTDFSIEIVAGQSVAVVGKSGCGKTTLCKLMLGLFKPSFGRISIDGKDLNCSENSWLLQEVSSVMQDDRLTTGSIVENIAFLEEQPDMSRVVEAAKMANVYDEIMEMPMRFESLVSEDVKSISGGQKQRIIIARALYRKPKVLIMDEATSNLDVFNERIISKNISDSKITRIIFAHRPETIKSADAVYNLVDNKWEGESKIAC